jgi:hypothetical protein
VTWISHRRRAVKQWAGKWGDSCVLGPELRVLEAHKKLRHLKLKRCRRSEELGKLSLKGEERGRD